MTSPSITRTRDELSIVCAQEIVPHGVRSERDRRCLQVVGPLDFALTGVLASLAVPLAEAGVSIFALSTYDTDYLLVKDADLEKAVIALTDAGHQIRRSPDPASPDCHKEERSTMKLRALLFDLDDTLANRGRSIVRYAPHFVERFGNQLNAIDLDTLSGIIAEADGGGYTPKPEMFAQLVARLPWRDPPDTRALWDHWYGVFPSCAEAMPGLYTTLDRLQALGLRLGIITNGPTHAQNGVVDALDIRRYMEVVIVSDAVGIRKPDADIFRLASQEMGVPAESACFVGDHPINDIVGARQAGLTPIWMRGRHPWPWEYKLPEFQIVVLAELPGLIEQIGVAASD